LKAETSNIEDEKEGYIEEPDLTGKYDI